MLLSACSFYSHATTLLILGDSLSAGYMMSLEESWPVLLQTQWNKENQNITIINSSISGSTTQDGLARLPALMEKHHPDAVLIELGANDGLRGFPTTVPDQTLQKIIGIIQKYRSQPLLMQIRIPRNYGAIYIEKLEAIYPNLSSKFKIPLLPFFMEQIVIHPELMREDGIHPTAAAQPKITAMMAPLLLSELKSLPRQESQ